MPERRAVVAARRLQLGAAEARTREQIRGGIGLFSGRTPYVWLSNQYGNTGIEFTRLQRHASTPTTGSRSCPTRQPADDGPAARRRRNEIDLIDPDFKYPSLVRGNLAYDRELAVRAWSARPSSSTRRTSRTSGTRT